jgi:hypothetical protein
MYESIQKQTYFVISAFDFGSKLLIIDLFLSAFVHLVLFEIFSNNEVYL